MSQARYLLPMGLLAGEGMPRRQESPFVTSDVGIDTLRMFAGQEARESAAACEAAARAEHHHERETQVGLAREHALRVQHLNLLLRLRGHGPIIGPAIRVL